MHSENILTAFNTVGTSDGLLTEKIHKIVCGKMVNSNVKNIPNAAAIFNDLLATYSTPL